MFQQTFQNFKFNFNSLNEGNVVSGGDLITGHISFDLTKQTKITSITMAVKGAAEVRWTAGGGKKKQKRVYSAKVSYFDFKTDLSRDNGAVEGSIKLQPGTHMYPFSCQLPHGDFPSAFRGVCGHISYTLTVGIYRPWHVVKNFMTELKFVDRKVVNQPDMWAPLSGTNRTTSGCMWFSSSPVTMTASTEKKAFKPGETVKVICQFSNGSSKTAYPKVKLQEKHNFYTHNRRRHRTAVKTLAAVSGEPVSAQTTDRQEEITITIPPSALLSISNCAIISVEHIIEVSLCLRPCNDVTVLFPIILCDTSASAHPHLN